MPRPLVGEGEAELDRRLLGRDFLEAGLDALPRPLGRHLLAIAAGPSEQGFDSAQLLDQLLFALAGLGRARHDDRFLMVWCVGATVGVFGPGSWQ